MTSSQSARVRQPIKSRMGTSTVDRIVVRDLDLVNDLLGKVDLGQMAWLEITGQLPTPSQAAVFNAVLVTLVEHGLTPNAIAARLTYLGAPEALQGAVAAGLCGMGSVFAGGSEGTVNMLLDARSQNPDRSEAETAKAIVSDFMSNRKQIPGLGHHLHKPIDPRSKKLFEIAQQHGLRGKFVSLLEAIQAEAEARTSRLLPINATGAIGALCCELGLPRAAARGVAVIGRSVGLVGHLVEEAHSPIAKEIWLRAEEESSEPQE